MPASCKSAWVSSVVLQESIHSKAEHKVWKISKPKSTPFIINIVESYQNNWQDLVNPFKKYTYYYIYIYIIFHWTSLFQFLPSRQSKLLGLSRVNDSPADKMGFCPTVGNSNKIQSNKCGISEDSESFEFNNSNLLHTHSQVKTTPKRVVHWKFQTRGSWPLCLLANGCV